MGNHSNQSMKVMDRIELWMTTGWQTTREAQRPRGEKISLKKANSDREWHSIFSPWWWWIKKVLIKYVIHNESWWLYCCIISVTSQQDTIQYNGCGAVARIISPPAAILWHNVAKNYFVWKLLFGGMQLMRQELSWERKYDEIMTRIWMRQTVGKVLGWNNIPSQHWATLADHHHNKRFAYTMKIFS